MPSAASRRPRRRRGSRPQCRRAADRLPVRNRGDRSGRHADQPHASHPRHAGCRTRGPHRAAANAGRSSATARAERRRGPGGATKLTLAGVANSLTGSGAVAERGHVLVGILTLYLLVDCPVCIRIAGSLHQSTKLTLNHQAINHLFRDNHYEVHIPRRRQSHMAPHALARHRLFSPNLNKKDISINLPVQVHTEALSRSHAQPPQGADVIGERMYGNIPTTIRDSLGSVTIPAYSFGEIAATRSFAHQGDSLLMPIIRSGVIVSLIWYSGRPPFVRLVAPLRRPATLIST
jgi:hypothetical protein